MVAGVESISDALVMDSGILRDGVLTEMLDMLIDASEDACSKVDFSSVVD